MSKSTDVTLQLIEAVQQGRELLPPDSVHEFPAAEAERLLALGAARVPPPPAVPASAGKARVVTALSDAGAKFQKLGAKKAVEFILEQKDAALVAELQAIEFRRDDGPRTEVMEALQQAFTAIAKPPEG